MRPEPRPSGGHFECVGAPKIEGISSGVAIGFGGETIAAGTEDRVDLVMCGQKSLRLSRRLETPHEFLSLSGRPMGSFDLVVQALVRTMISVRRKVADRPDVTAQLVGDHDPRRAMPVDQPLQEPAGGLRITLLLHENVEHVPIRVDCPPEPELHAIDRNNDFIQVPFVTGAGPVALDARGEMAPEPVRPIPVGFPANQHAAFRKQILDIRRAQRKTMIRPNRKGDDLAGKR